MQKTPVERPRDTTEELMLAADVARLSGHPQDAVPYLQRVILRQHPRAVLAAFTLGRLQQRELGAPAQAAEAFRRAYELAPAGSLAKDALAHEVECLARAGRSAQAATRAQLYLEKYPNGPKRDRMRRLAEVER